MTVVDKGRYGRWVEKVMQRNVDLNKTLVGQGSCWRYLTSDKAREYTAAQVEAKTAERRPWEFRRKM